MRELKFRAWDKIDKSMSAPFDLYSIGCVNGENGYPSEYYTLLQYTGLKDKNGKEIYEGDIIQRYGEGRYKVYWHEFTACWRMDGHTGITKGDMALACEVIGHIYENSDLLDTEER